MFVMLNSLNFRICKANLERETQVLTTSSFALGHDGGNTHFVFYTKTILKNSGEREYSWITKRCETYDHAKDRTGLLEPEIDQDYQLVNDAANKKGFDGVKILIIGAPGSGKTFSLQTLIKETK